ncbi:hypothetical protein OAK19_02435 [Aureispira]|nr:hypothetical protein [Aureispira sp.]
MSYPQSSCICENCPSVMNFEREFPPNTVQTNLITNGCSLPEMFNCTNVQIYNRNEQPDLKTPLTPKTNPIEILNEEFGMKPAADFVPVECSNLPKLNPNKVGINLNVNSLDGCSTPLYYSKDPRLLSQTRGQVLLLDKPVYSGDVKWKNIYNENLRNYGKYYKDYADIHAGQIQYYKDLDLEDVLYKPNFTIKSNIKSEIFKDPMGSIKFQSKRRPLLIDGSNVHTYQTMRDEMQHREDLLHLKMAVMNQTDYSMATNLS